MVVTRVRTDAATDQFTQIYAAHHAEALRLADLRPRGADEQIADTGQIFAALRDLPPRQRQVVVLRFYEDLAEKDIADLMGISIGTLKSTLHRGLERLRELVGEEVA